MKDKEWQEMECIWKQAGAGAPDMDTVLRYVTERAERFDRDTRFRNWRETFGGVFGVVMVWFFVRNSTSAVEIAFALGMVGLLVGLTSYLLTAGRTGPKVDPALSRTEYVRAMEAKYARQIRVLRRAKYWFAIPVVATGGVTAWAYLTANVGGADLFYFPLLCVGTTVAWYLNERVKVPQLEQEWESVRRALDGGEMA